MTVPLTALSKGAFLEFSMNKQPKCPHCGEEYDISDNEAWRLYSDDESHEVECPSCELPFVVHSHADWRFSTDEQGD